MSCGTIYESLKKLLTTRTYNHLIFKNKKIRLEGKFWNSDIKLLSDNKLTQEVE